MTAKRNSRADQIIAFVTANPGCTLFSAARHLLSEADRLDPTTKPFKRAFAAVERVIKKRLVRLSNHRLYPWYRELFDRATALERVVKDDPTALRVAAEAWRVAGDDNRAKILLRFAEAASRKPPVVD